MMTSIPETCALQETTLIAGKCACRHGSQIVQAPDDEHELALMHRIKAGDSNTSQQLITSNLLHVLRSNRRYAHSGTGIFDLIEAGNRGLAHALENFEPNDKGRFSAYAAMCIRQHIELALNSRHSTLPQDGSPAICPQCV